MPRPALTSEQISDFRERLCAVATRRFAASGYSGVSMRALSLELGCSPTTPYRYFRDKDEIFAIVRARAFDRLASYTTPVISDGVGPVAQLEALGVAYIRFACLEPDAYRLAFQLDQPTAVEFPELLDSRNRAWHTIRAVVRRAIEAGDIEGDLDVVSHVFWAGIHGLVALHLAGQLKEVRLERLREPMVQTLLRGVLPAAKHLEGDD
ncbi:MAG: TetR/AcrR family transcriptional regulator [bacterium]|nr:TetR/AcrR family transcriptional regulator [bacterium]